VLGSRSAPRGQAFDAGNPLHVDEAASALLRRALEDDDFAAFELLVDLCSERLAEVARRVAREVGLGMPSDELVVAFFAGLFGDPRPMPAASRHFLAWAHDCLRQQAEAWVRDMALLDTPDPMQQILPPEPQADGSRSATRQGSPQDFYLHALKICLHRLDLESRQMLVACDVQGLPLEAAAASLELGVPEARRRYEQARLRLNAAIAAVIKGVDP